MEQHVLVREHWSERKLSGIGTSTWFAPIAGRRDLVSSYPEAENFCQELNGTHTPANPSIHARIFAIEMRACSTILSIQFHCR